MRLKEGIGRGGMGERGGWDFRKGEGMEGGGSGEGGTLGREREGREVGAGKVGL